MNTRYFSIGSTAWKRIALLSGVALVAAFLIDEPAFAAETPATEAEFLNKMNQVFNYVLGIINSVMWPVILMIGSLLDNELIFGGAMGGKLQEVWVQIRNLVNIAFVLVLLAVAIYNVLGLGEESGNVQLAFKQMMPKFVIALLLVNFSFLGAKLVLDFTNVMAGAVFALPGKIADGNATGVMQEVCENESKEAALQIYCQDQKLTAKAQRFFSKLDKQNITVVYAVKFAKAHQFKYIKDGIKDIKQLGFNIIFNTVLSVAYGLCFVALFLVLLLRVVVLWVAVALSPLLAVGIIFPSVGQYLKAGDSNFQEMFVNEALAPLKVGVFLSLGYIMLSTFQVDASIHGELLAGNSLSDIDPNTLPTALSDLQQLMIAVAVVAVVWKGVFAVAETTVAKGLTGFIRDNAQGFGKWVAKLPTYAQVIPTGKSKLFGGRPTASFAEISSTLKHEALQFERSHGSPLTGVAGPSPQQLKDFKNKVHTKDSLASDVKASPQILFDRGGWKDFTEKIERLHGPQAAEKLKKAEDLRDFKTKGSFADLPSDLRTVLASGADPISSLDELIAHGDSKLQEAGKAKDDVERAKAGTPAKAPAVEAPGKEKSAAEIHTAFKATEKDSLPQLIKSGTAFEGWTKEGLEKLKELVEPVQKAIIDGKVQGNALTQPDFDKIRALKVILEGGKIDAVVAGSQGIPTPVVEELIRAYAPDEQKDNVLQKLNETRPGAPPAGAAPPPPAAAP